MKAALLAQSAFVQEIQQDELACLEIHHPSFSAKLTLQGAQLLQFAPSGEQNWLWLSEFASYKKGNSVRGGIPICWPWFGNPQFNPKPVQNSILNIEQAPAHGFARAHAWDLIELCESADSVCLTLKLIDDHHAHWQFPLQALVRFIFKKDSVSVALTTTNQHSEPVTFSQALHTYFPTADINATQVAGADQQTYIDTLENWSEKTQHGNIEFNGETDRIYYGSNVFDLITPEHTTRLQAQGSNSAVVWNPWIDKSQRLSQFAPDAWQRMFCVETANALADAITLASGASHILTLTLTR